MNFCCKFLNECDDVPYDITNAKSVLLICPNERLGIMKSLLKGKSVKHIANIEYNIAGIYDICLIDGNSYKNASYIFNYIVDRFKGNTETFVVYEQA